MDGGPLLPREPDARIAGLDGFDRAADDCVGERVGAVDRREPGFLGDVALDPQLLGMAEPEFAFVDAENEGDRIAVMDKAALLEQIHHRVDVIPPARRPGLDQAAGSMDAQPLGVEDGRRLEFRRERFRRQSVGRLMALGVGPLHGRRRVEDGFRRPADGSRLLPPDRLRLVLAFAEPSGRACFVQELLLALERELVPLHGVIFGVAFASPITWRSRLEKVATALSGISRATTASPSASSPTRTPSARRRSASRAWKIAPYSWTLWAVSAFESIEPTLPSSVTTRFGMKLWRW